ncbi:hypothetical protein H5410_022169 [Solanum commersonii]|uniref:Uncharacterized protein n=1 Tax=Solanum commersonii TaxID=4109 RepID=A0A9J5ZGD1_SOLCO|nr:hypothetical protein H5410_022169 [Solanum commersonii]
MKEALVAIEIKETELCTQKPNKENTKKEEGNMEKMKYFLSKVRRNISNEVHNQIIATVLASSMEKPIVSNCSKQKKDRKDSNWSRGITSPGFGGVPYTFCKERQGCQVTLYPDADTPDDDITNYLKSQGLFEPQRCWEDIFDAINNLNHMIYIAGWSVYTKIILIKNPKRSKVSGELTLEKLLKKKASKRVNVLLLVWDDITTDEVLIRHGLMSTHDQETADYFKNTDVHGCLLLCNVDSGKIVI